MISITITSDAADAGAFLVRVSGRLERPRALNEELAVRLVAELQEHFRARNTEPNKLGASKTNFWEEAAENTAVKEISDTGATVQVGADAHVRIHYLGGVVKPTGGRKFLTIPLIPAARGLSASGYERESGRKLFRLPGSKVLLERTKDGTQSLLRRERPTLRTRGGHKVFNLMSGTRVRPVYALAEKAVIPRDPRALPPGTELAAALQDAANAWAEREMKRKGGSQ